MTNQTAGKRSLAAVWEPLSSPRMVVIYLVVGAVSNGFYLSAFALLSHAIIPYVANVIALLATTVTNTAAHRRFTFGIRGAERRLRAQAGGLVALGLELGLTSGALGLLQMLVHNPQTTAAVIVLWTACAVASWMRFGPLRFWLGAAAMGWSESAHSEEDTHVAGQFAQSPAA